MNRFFKSLLCVLALCFAVERSSGATVYGTFTNSYGLPDTNSFLIYPLSSPVANADGSFTTAGPPLRVRPNSSGYWQTNLMANNYLASNQFLGKGIAFRAPDDLSPINLYSFWSNRISGYNTFVTIVYGTNPPPTSAEVTNALGYLPFSPTQTTNAALQAALNATNGFGTIVYSNSTAYIHTNALPGLTNGFVTSAVISGLATTNFAKSVTNGYTSLTTTNPTQVLYTNYLPALTNAFVTSAVTNGLAGTNFVNTTVNNATNPLATRTYVQNATNSLGSAAFKSANIFQPASSILTNIALTGASTNIPVPGTGMTFSTNSNGQVTYNASTNGSGGVSVTHGALATASTNGVVVSVNALSQTNSFTSIVFSNSSLFYPRENISNYVTGATVTNLATGITNGFSALVLTNVGQVLYTNYLPVLTNRFAVTNFSGAITMTNNANRFGHITVAAITNAGTNYTGGVMSSGRVSTDTGFNGDGTGITNIPIASIVNAPTTNNLVRTNDTRALLLQNITNRYYGGLVNGVNYGDAFSSPGEDEGSEQFGLGSSTFGKFSTVIGFGAETGTESTLHSNNVSIGYLARSTGWDSLNIGSYSQSSTQSLVFGSHSSSGGKTNAMLFGNFVTNASNNEIRFGSTNQFVVFPGNGTVGGIWTNLSTVVTNLMVGTDPLIYKTTNSVSIRGAGPGAGSVRANGTYIWNSTLTAYTNSWNAFHITNAASIWYLYNSALAILYSSASLETNAWTQVTGGATVPSSSHGEVFDLNGTQPIGDLSAWTNLMYHITNYSHRIATNAGSVTDGMVSISTGLDFKLMNITNAISGSFIASTNGYSGGVLNIEAFSATNAYAANLAGARVFNVTNYGAVPYIPPTIIAGSYPTSYTDNFTALSNMFLHVSNQPAPRIIYFPAGVYGISGTLTVPPLTSIQGEGWFHQGGAGATRVSTGTSQVATNQFSILWFIAAAGGNTNGTGLRVPYTSMGPQYFRSFEICGYTNPLADLGQGFSAGTIEVASSTNFGWNGINFDGNTYCGGFEMENVTVTGWRVGVNHAGNFCEYRKCNFVGNDIAFLNTNIWAPDQVIIRQCSIGNRQGGLGYWVSMGRGWMIEDPCDIDYYCFAVILKSQVTIIGGNTEANSTTPPSWTFFQNGTTTYYTSNNWPYVKKALFHLNYLNGVDNDQTGNLTVIGGQYSNGTSIMDGLFCDHSAGSSAGFNITSINNNWDTTNTIGGIKCILVCNAFRSDAIAFIGNNANKVAFAETWRGFGAGGRKYVNVVGTRALIGDTEFQLNYQRDFVYGAADPSFTNVVFKRWGQIEIQQGGTAEPDWIQYQGATNYASGIPNMAPFRVFQGDSSPYIAGRPSTNATLNYVRLVGGTNVNPQYDQSMTLQGTNLWVYSGGVWRCLNP